jgi:hypothetical protein
MHINKVISRASSRTRDSTRSNCGGSFVLQGTSQSAAGEQLGNKFFGKRAPEGRDAPSWGERVRATYVSIPCIAARGV